MITIRLLGGFDLESLAMPRLAVQRLVAYLAVRQRPIQRDALARVLWPVTTRDQALSDLRNTLYQARREVAELVESDRRAVRLVPEVKTDLAQGERVVRRLTAGGSPEPGDLELLSDELLPGWDDPWARTERRRWHELRVDGLESLSDRLRGLGRVGEATIAAQAAVEAEPFRQRAVAMLADAYMRAGDHMAAEGVREEYRQRTSIGGRAA